MSSKQVRNYRSKLGGNYGKRGGRPSSIGKLLVISTPQYDEIIAFLNSQPIKRTKFFISIGFMKKYEMILGIFPLLWE